MLIADAKCDGESPCQRAHRGVRLEERRRPPQGLVLSLPQMLSGDAKAPLERAQALGVPGQAARGRGRSEAVVAEDSWCSVRICCCTEQGIARLDGAVEVVGACRSQIDPLGDGVFKVR